MIYLEDGSEAYYGELDDLHVVDKIAVNRWPPTPEPLGEVCYTAAFEWWKNRSKDLACVARGAEVTHNHDNDKEASRVFKLGKITSRETSDQETWAVCVWTDSRVKLGTVPESLLRHWKSKRRR